MTQMAQTQSNIMAQTQSNIMAQTQSNIVGTGKAWSWETIKKKKKDQLKYLFWIHGHNRQWN